MSKLLKIGIIIPVYNHEEAIESTLEKALSFPYQVVLVDDGSTLECKNVLEALAGKHPEQVNLIRLEHNCGKGGAVKVGLHFLYDSGFTHAIQVDSDGQHDLSDLPKFVQLAEHKPSVLISGAPIYDQSVPKHRYYARYLTHVWVWINSLSFDIKDSMCGFRMYPLQQTIDLLAKSPCGNRMDFDTEILVRWSWLGHKVQHIPTKVSYPIDGVSHFNAVKDNVLISYMHTRLFFGMLIRIPMIIWNKIRV